MVGIAIAVFCLFMLPVISMTVGASAFLRLLKSSQPVAVDRDLPKVAIVMSVRGNDPSLDASITALLQQDYPDYCLQIVVDNIDDPAWIPINAIVERSNASNVKVSALEKPYETCSLKCSALVQGISSLDPSYEVIAVVDSDMVAYSTWLRELVAPMQDPSVGITSGIRWYMPQDSQYGSWVRYLWNVSGAVHMYLYRCPWGGSMAIRRSLFYEGGLLDIWKSVLSDDNTASTAAHRMGLTLSYVPTLILVNHERCDLKGCWRFVKRQFLWTRLYSPFWKLISFQAIFRLTIITLGIACLIVSLWTFNIVAIAWLSASFILYLSTLMAILITLESKVKIILSAREKSNSKVSLLQIFQSLVALPLAHALSIFGVLAAMGMKTVEWRGVDYQIATPLQVKLINYLPYRQTKREREIQSSIL